ncbi:MAG TPA: citrate synthase [Polyangiaceae bacterium]
MNQVENEAKSAVKSGGLEGVSVADTALSDVDGERGRLVVAGRDVEALAGSATFEDVVALLLRAADASGDLDVRTGLARGRAAGFEALARVGDATAITDGMASLRASLAHLETEEPLTLVGATATLAAAWSRARAGEAPIRPDPASTHARDYLRMLGVDPTDARTAAIDAYLVTVAEHGMNASTFTARVVASTGSDLVSSIVAAVGALKGPLHGGAPGPVLDMLDAIGGAENAEKWLESELAAKRRIMGMGHRIYRVRDPRAAVLEGATLRLEAAGVKTTRLELARAVERAANDALSKRHPDRPLRANVEFYTAVLLDTVGLPRASFSPTFAVGRVAGWCAHVLEQRRTGRIIRPASRYVGVVP